MIYTQDHRPAHVHVLGSGGDNIAVFFLNCPDGPMTLRQVVGFTLREVNSIQKKLSPQLTALCESWHLIHGGRQG